MNRNEIINLLEVISSAYPNTKIKDPKAIVSAWELTLGGFSAESVYKAARLHLETSKFFPTPSEIADKIVRADLIYSVRPGKALEAPKRAKVTSIPDGMTVEEFIDGMWDAVLETELDIDEQKAESSVLGRSLPYEQ